MAALLSRAGSRTFGERLPTRGVDPRPSHRIRAEPVRSRGREVAARLQDTAEAFEEIGEIDLAIDWAKQATDFDRGHQSLKASA